MSDWKQELRRAVIDHVVKHGEVNRVLRPVGGMHVSQWWEADEAAQMLAASPIDYTHNDKPLEQTTTKFSGTVLTSVLLDVRLEDGTVIGYSFEGTMGDLVAQAVWS